ncbi:hypothetical protein L1887_53807 [Cichorium endivia]|nr:hypothetical protein L1887_53807 [Cichorium endivia]
MCSERGVPVGRSLTSQRAKGNVSTKPDGYPRVHLEPDLDSGGDPLGCATSSLCTSASTARHAQLSKSGMLPTLPRRSSGTNAVCGGIHAAIVVERERGVVWSCSGDTDPFPCHLQRKMQPGSESRRNPGGCPVGYTPLPDRRRRAWSGSQQHRVESRCAHHRQEESPFSLLANRLDELTECCLYG